MLTLLIALIMTVPAPVEPAPPGYEWEDYYGTPMLCHIESGTLSGAPAPCGWRLDYILENPAPTAPIDPVTGCTRAVPSTHCPWDLADEPVQELPDPETVVVETPAPAVAVVEVVEPTLDEASVLETTPFSAHLRYI